MSLSKTYQTIPRNDMLQLWLAIQNVQREMDRRREMELIHQQGRARRGRAALEDGTETLFKYSEDQWRLSCLKAEFRKLNLRNDKP